MTLKTDLKQLFKENNKNLKSMFAKINHDKFLVKEIKEERVKLKFLNNSCSISEIVYCLLYNVTIAKTCLKCNKKVSFKNFRDGYRFYCSTQCSNNDNIIKEKIRRTNLLKYNSTTPLGNDIIKKKLKETLKKKYGVINVSQIKEVKEKKKQTLLKHYGVDNPSKSAEIQKRKQITCYKKYGVKHWMLNSKNLESFKKILLKSTKES